MLIIKRIKISLSQRGIAKLGRRTVPVQYSLSQPAGPPAYLAALANITLTMSNPTNLADALTLIRSQRVRIAELEEYAADRDERVQRLESRVGRLVTVTLYAFMYSDNIHKL